MQTNTTNVNKTWALLQTTGGKSGLSVRDGNMYFYPFKMVIGTYLSVYQRLLYKIFMNKFSNLKKMYYL